MAREPVQADQTASHESEAIFNWNCPHLLSTAGKRPLKKNQNHD